MSDDRSAKSKSGERPGVAPLKTAPPPFNPEKFARDSESMPVSERGPLPPTTPPEPFYSDLRDSCSEHMLAAAAIEPPPDSNDWQSEARAAHTGSDGLPTAGAVPTLAIPRAELAWLELDADTNALAFGVNGRDSVEGIAMACKVPIASARRIFKLLAARRAVTFR